MNNIKKIRKKRKLTQTELGEKLGITKQQICAWEKNIHQPSLQNMIKLSVALETNINELIN